MCAISNKNQVTSSMAMNSSVNAWKGLCKTARREEICFNLSETRAKVNERVLLELLSLTWSQCLWFLVVLGLGQAPQLWVRCLTLWFWSSWPLIWLELLSAASFQGGIWRPQGSLLPSAICDHWPGSESLRRDRWPGWHIIQTSPRAGQYHL